MKIRCFILPTITLTLFIAGCGHDLKEMDQRIDTIQKDIDAVKQQMASQPLRRDVLRKIPRKQLTPENEQEYLEVIAVPVPPNMIDLTRFIDDSDDLNRFLQNRKLIQPWLNSQVQALGRDYLPYLLPFAQRNLWKSVEPLLLPEDKQMLWEKSLFYPALLNGYIKFIDASDTELILKMLPLRERLIGPVVKLKLTEKAMPVIMKKLKQGYYFQSYTLWLDTALKNTTSDEQQEIYKLAFQVMRRHYNNFNTAFMIAETMAGHGFMPAYESMVKLASVYPSKPWQNKIIALSPCKDMKEFNTWYYKNRDNLIFNHEKNIYYEGEKNN